jgi:hypothetical protein
VSEKWRPVPEFEGLYEASYFGAIFSVRSGKIMTPRLDKYGYEQICVHKNKKQMNVSVHSFVLKAFKGLAPFEGAQCRHLDGNKRNNWADNLAWGTSKENILNTISHNTHVCLRTNEEHPGTRHSNDIVDAIRKEYITTRRITLGTLARKYGISRSQVCRYVNYQNRPFIK